MYVVYGIEYMVYDICYIVYKEKAPRNSMVSGTPLYWSYVCLTKASALASRIAKHCRVPCHLQDGRSMRHRFLKRPRHDIGSVSAHIYNVTCVHSLRLYEAIWQVRLRLAAGCSEFKAGQSSIVRKRLPSRFM